MTHAIRLTQPLAHTRRTATTLTCLLLLLLGSTPLPPQARAELIPGWPDIAPEPGHFSRFQEGMIAAAEYHRSLIPALRGADNRAVLFGEAAALFVKLTQKPLRGGFNLDRFQLRPEVITERIIGKGARPDPKASLDRFLGPWHGTTTERSLTQDWGSCWLLEPARRPTPREGPLLHAAQFLLTGTGFGWHAVASHPDFPRERYLLGTHFLTLDGSATQVIRQESFVAVDAGERRFIRFSPTEIRFEEVIPEFFSKPERYIVTGFRYAWDGNNIINQGNGFQYVFTRDPSDRPAPKQIPLQLRTGILPQPKANPQRTPLPR